MGHVQLVTATTRETELRGEVATADFAGIDVPFQASRPREELEALEEVELIEIAQRGEREAFRILYLRHCDRVRRCGILPIVSEAAVADDLLADTFVRALEHLHRFRWQGRGILPWLLRIARNLSLDYKRRGRKVTPLPTRWDPADIDAVSIQTYFEHAQMVSQFRSQIAACLEHLNPRYACVIRLRLIEQRNRLDAARELNVTIGTLDVLLFRACRSFRKVYEQRYGSFAPLTQDIVRAGSERSFERSELR